MDMLTMPFRLPFLPVQGVIRLAELIQDEAERELHDPARVRRELAEALRARDAGEISAAELRQIEDRLTETLVGGQATAGAERDD